MPEASQRFHMDVANFFAAQGSFECVLVELRVVARPGDGPHVSDLANSVSSKQFHKLIYGSRRVAYGEHGSLIQRGSFPSTAPSRGSLWDKTPIELNRWVRVNTP